MFESVSYERSDYADAIVICVFEGEEFPVGISDASRDAVNRKEFIGKSGQIAQAFPTSGPREIVLGLGKKEVMTRTSLRTAFRSVALLIDEVGFDVVHFNLEELDDSEQMGEDIGLAFGFCAFDEYQFRGELSKDSPAKKNLKISCLQENIDKGLQVGLKKAEASNLTRMFVNTPPNIAIPLWLADQAADLANSSDHLSCKVFSGEELVRENLHGLLNVGRASEHEPCMIRIEFNKNPGDGQKPVVLIGKAITYDTGGYSIKSKTGMPGMKYDKAGGCAVIGMMKSVAEVIQPDFPVVALIVAAENAISGEAYMPDDVFTYRNGVSVEVTNTDAEGRLVLADALCYACDVENPDVIFDFATLTGGVVTALGEQNAGFFSTCDDIANSLSIAGNDSGETVWRLPMDQRYKDMMRSKVADILNSKPGGKAHPVAGAAFLSYFVKPDINWVHVDIAGVSRSGEYSLAPSGPSGFGVQLMTEWLRNR